MAPSTLNFVFTVAALLILSSYSLGAKSSVDRECTQIGNILRNKGFTYPWWEPSSLPSANSGCPALGKTLKCCPSSFDTPTHRREISTSFQKWLGSKLTAVKETNFGNQKKKFDLTFKALLQRAHTSFHAMFQRTYGMLYIQHADVFHALFKTLEKYYDDGRDHLESKLNEFFAILTRKMFEVLNAQYDFTESYLSCATIVISEKQGNDLHRQIVSSLRRSFVATRAFAQGLSEAERVISNINKLPLNMTDCLIPVSQMVNCPVCAENRAYKPCLPYCTTITAKCLSPTFILSKPWNDFSRAMEDLIDRLMGPYNAEAVVEPIHIKISEAIMNFQESGADLSQAVFSKCGKTTLKSRNFNKREVDAEPRVQAATGRERDQDNDKDDGSSAKSLEKILKDAKGRVKKAKDIWNVLPRQVCNSIGKDYSSQLCWNGTSTLKPDKDKKGKDGAEDSSVTIDLQPRGNLIPLIAEQILLLQLITDKLKTAYNGGDVQWVQELDPDDEFGSGIGMGSGSGEIPTDLEDTDDDDPSGDIHKIHKPPPVPSIPNFNLVPKKPTLPEQKPHIPYEESPRFPSPPLFNKPILSRDDEEEEEEEEETSNLNIDSRNNNNRPVSSGNDFGVDLPPTGGNKDPPRFPSYPIPTVPPQVPTTTTTRPSTTRITTQRTTTTWKPSMPDKPKQPLPPSPVVKDNPGAKTVAVVNVFTPVIMSMLQKLFNLN